MKRRQWLAVIALMIFLVSYPLLEITNNTTYEQAISKIAQEEGTIKYVEVSIRIPILSEEKRVRIEDGNFIKKLIHNPSDMKLELNRHFFSNPPLLLNHIYIHTDEKTYTIAFDLNNIIINNRHYEMHANNAEDVILNKNQLYELIRNADFDWGNTE